MEAEREAVAESSYSRACTPNVVKLVGTKETTRIRVVLPRRIKRVAIMFLFKTRGRMMPRPDTRIYAWLFVGATPAANFPAFQLRYEPLNFE